MADAQAVGNLRHFALQKGANGRAKGHELQDKRARLAIQKHPLQRISNKPKACNE